MLLTCRFSLFFFCFLHSTLCSAQRLTSRCIFILEPLIVDVTKSFSVVCVLECAQLCRAEQTCEAFKHRDVSGDINCQVTEGEPRHSTASEVDENEKWTVYTIMKFGQVRSYQNTVTTNSKGVYS